MKIRLSTLSMAIILIGMATAFAADPGSKDPDANATNTVQDDRVPVAVMSEPNFDFDPVVDGAQVTHDFSIKNTGDGPLSISKVRTG